MARLRESREKKTVEQKRRALRFTLTGTTPGDSSNKETLTRRHSGRRRLIYFWKAKKKKKIQTYSVHTDGEREDEEAEEQEEKKQSTGNNNTAHSFFFLSFHLSYQLYSLFNPKPALLFSCLLPSFFSFLFLPSLLLTSQIYLTVFEVCVCGVIRDLSLSHSFIFHFPFLTFFFLYNKKKTFFYILFLSRETHLYLYFPTLLTATTTHTHWHSFPELIETLLHTRVFFPRYGQRRRLDWDFD